MLIHRGERFQSGRGIGSLFSGIIRGLKPLFSMGLTAGKKLLTSDTAKKIGSTMLDMGKDAAKNLAVDLLEGKNLDESLNKEIQSAKAKIASKIKGAGRKRKKSSCKRTPLKKLKYSLLD